MGALALGVWVAAQAAVPVITNITMVAGTPQFRIQSDLGITNQIQYSTNLGQTNWTVLTNVVAIAGGAYHSLALQRDGTVKSWGGLTNVPVAFAYWQCGLLA